MKLQKDPDSRTAKGRTGKNTKEKKKAKEPDRKAVYKENSRKRGCITAKKAASDEN